MDHHLEFLKSLVAKGGPDAQGYYDLDAWIAEIAEHARKGGLATGNMECLRDVLGEAISAETMQCFVLHKPHGYAGDYEIIDRIYTRYVSDKTHLSKWISIRKTLLQFMPYAIVCNPDTSTCEHSFPLPSAC